MLNNIFLHLTFEALNANLYGVIRTKVFFSALIAYGLVRCGRVVRKRVLFFYFHNNDLRGHSLSQYMNIKI